MSIQVIKEILGTMGVMDSALVEEATIYEEIGLDSSEVVLLAVQLKKRLGVELELPATQDLTLAQLASRVDRELQRTSA